MVSLTLPFRISITKHWENRFNIVWSVSFFFLHNRKDIDVYLKNIKYRDKSYAKISKMIDDLHEDDEVRYFYILSMIENYGTIFKDVAMTTFLTKKLNSKME